MIGRRAGRVIGPEGPGRTTPETHNQPSIAMNGNFLKCAAGAMVLALGGGCASTQDGRTAQAQGTGLGALLGGGLAAGITALAGGSGDQIARNAAIGAAAGGVAGFAWGTEIAKRKARYASREAWMQAEIADAEATNRRIIAYNDELEARVARLESRARVARANNDKAEIRSIKREVQSVSQQASNTQAGFNKQADYYGTVAKDKEAIGTGQASTLRQLADSMQSNSHKVNATSRRLATLDNQLSI